MKSAKRLIISLIVILTICIPFINVSAVSGPASGNYFITNTANNLELRISSDNRIVLHNPDSFVWRLTEGPSRNPYYYTIVTQDNRRALAYDRVLNSIYVTIPDSSETSQRWLITPVTGGFNIESLDGLELAPGDPLAGNGHFLHAEDRSMTVPGAVRAGMRANNSQFVWQITSPNALTPTPTPTPTPTSTNLPRMPRPISNPANNSSIRSNERVQLLPPRQFPNATVVYSLLDPNRHSNVTWYPASTPINTPSSGNLEVWAKTNATSGYQESDVEYFIFRVDRGPAHTPTPTPTPHRPPQQLEQVILRVTMGELSYTVNGSRYTVNGTPLMFDVAPYLDTRENRSMIPMRFIAEAFGATVTWDDATKTQHIHLGGRSFSLTENRALPGGMGTPVLVRDRFFVPLRYVSQELGANVTWDGATQTNTISYFR